MLLAVPTPEEIAEAQREVDIEDAEARGRAELLNELESYMKKHQCSLEKAYQEIKAKYEKPTVKRTVSSKSTGKTR